SAPRSACLSASSAACAAQSRPPEVSSAAFRAPSPDLRSACLGSRRNVVFAPEGFQILEKETVVLSREEVHRILERVHTPVYRACLKTIYSCGLRLREGSHLQITDIDSGRMFLHIHGKGGKDRYVPLADRTLKLLREFWTTHRSLPWLFPATRRGVVMRRDSLSLPMVESSD